MSSHLRTSAMPSARPMRSSISRDTARPRAALLWSRRPILKVKTRVMAALSMSWMCANLRTHAPSPKAIARQVLAWSLY